MKQFKITHLYPKHMSLYGDRGNVLVLARTAQEAGCVVQIQDCDPGDRIDSDTNLILLGGGQDHDQEKVLKDLLSRQTEIKSLISSGATFLGVCGGYQLIGEYYEDAAGNYLDGLKILNFKTSNAKQHEKRIIGNVKAISERFGVLFGFENHGGRTFLSPDLRPLAKILQGGGNNAQDGTEGVIADYGQGFIIGTYFHSFLAKNPHVASYLVNRNQESFYKTDPIETLNRTKINALGY